MEKHGEGLPLWQRSMSHIARGSTKSLALISSTSAAASRRGTDKSTNAATSDATG